MKRLFWLSLSGVTLAHHFVNNYRRSVTCISQKKRLSTKKYARIMSKVSNMPLETFLSLKQIALLRIAKKFWDLPQVKKRVLTFVKDNVEVYHLDCNHLWVKLTEELLATWDTYLLPLDLKRHLLYTIREVGRRIFDWSECIKWQRKYIVVRKHTAKNAATIVSSIRWTPCGIVDEFKTYKILSKIDPNFDIVHLYKVACMHAMEDQISYLWKRMSKSKRKFLATVNRCNWCMVAYWKYRRDNDFNALKSFFEESAGFILTDDFPGEPKTIDPYTPKPYDENLSVDENMILISMQQGLINSVKYFWNKLPEDCRMAKLLDYLHFTLMVYVDYNDFNDSLSNYKRERLAEVYVFFISQMNDDHKKEFQKTTAAAAIFEESHKINVSRMEWLLRPAWPWHNLISQGLKDLVQRRNFSTRLAYYLFCEITRSEVEQFKKGLIVNKSELQSLVQDIWKSIPRNQRRHMTEPWLIHTDYKGKHFISNLIDARDFDTLKNIVNKSGTEAIRDKLIYEVLKRCDSLIITDDYQLLEELINQLGKSTRERLSFRRQVDALEYFIKKDNYDLADKLVDWKCWEPRMNEYTKLYRVMDLKERFKNQCPPTEWICNLWVKFSENIDEAMERSSRFVNWVFMTELARNRFIKQTLITANTKKILDKHELSTQVIEEFYSWCNLAQEEPFFE